MFLRREFFRNAFATLTGLVVGRKPEQQILDDVLSIPPGAVIDLGTCRVRELEDRLSMAVKEAGVQKTLAEFYGDQYKDQSHAFAVHSSRVCQAIDRLEAALKGVDYRDPRVNMDLPNDLTSPLHRLECMESEVRRLKDWYEVCRRAEKFGFKAIEDV